MKKSGWPYVWKPWMVVLYAAVCFLVGVAMGMGKL